MYSTGLFTSQHTAHGLNDTPPPTMVAGLWPMENCVPELSCTAARSRHDFPAIDPKTSSQAEELNPLPPHLPSMFTSA